MFVVADQAPVQYQDPVGLLDPPPLRLRDEAGVLRVAFDESMPRSTPCATTWFLKPWSTRAFSTVPPTCSATWSSRTMRGVVVRVRGEDDDGDDQAQHIDGQAPLAARHPFHRMRASGTSFTLTVRGPSYEGRTDFEQGRIFGHENLGEVTEVGAGVDRVRVGDLVCLPFNISCGFCRN
ncbi:alcohol dehydrogenase catalytic domain-containing protein, partial [Streptomyces sp. NPDC094153]|uniref:alcohol dehydrogenase catalytic domain-containing protein n=1 Tax=Streptomyces sp. NPDC094153 TaxID=3366058 RepID=UPI00382F0078